MDDRVILVRRSDGVGFHIHSQARSPNGPCELRGVDPPHEVVSTTNDRVFVDFIDPRRKIPSCERCRAEKSFHLTRKRWECLDCDRGPAREPLDVSGIPAADEYERQSDEALRAKARSDAERILAAVKRHLDGGRRVPFDPVMRGGNLSDGGIAMANEALAPLRWRVEYRETREHAAERAMRWTLEHTL